MALLFCDSFDHYATGDILEKWTSKKAGSVSPVSVISANGRTANCLDISSGGRVDCWSITPQMSSATSSGVVGFAMKIGSGALANINYPTSAQFLTIRQANGTAHLSVRLASTGLFTVYRGLAATPLGSNSLAIQGGVWAYVEFKWDIQDSGGSFYIRVNGTETVLTSLDTRNGGDGTWSSLAFFGDGFDYCMSFDGNSDHLYLDDLYILNLTDSGITGRPNNDFLGDVSVRYMAPTSDSAVTWDRTGAGLTANFEVVEDTTPDDDTTYVSTSTVDEIDYYGFPDVTSGAEVYGVQAVISAKKGDTGSAQISACVKVSGGSDREHPTPLGVASNTAYSYALFPWDGSPETGQAWTESEVNGAAFGPRKTA